MSDFEAYKRSYDEAKEYFHGQISDRETKAFEYGTIVVRNAVLVSGGGLLAIPAIVGLSAEMPLDSAQAAKAGFFFALALLISILGAYTIHICWTLHVEAWERYWSERQELLKKMNLEDVPRDQLNLETKEQLVWPIRVTFWLPHFFAVIYLILIFCGFWQLYEAFGVAG